LAGGNGRGNLLLFLSHQREVEKVTHDQLLSLTGDQIKYFEFSLRWPDLLTQNIPFGFPLYVKLIEKINIALLPYVTLTLWIGAICFLLYSLVRSGFNLWMTYGIVLPLALTLAMRPWLWHGNPYFYGNTERLTAILATILFALIVDDHGNWPVSIVTFLMALVRPAMLFVPVVVWLMKPTIKRGWTLALPFILFCGLRWVVAGEPTFCSYGAVQATRIYAMMVEPGDLAKVPEKFHPLMEKIMWKHVETGGIEFDRQEERDFYHRWYNGDFYQPEIKGYSNAFLRELWGYEFRLHWRQRIWLYVRALRVALTKIQDPLLVFGLMGFLWVYSLTRGNFAFKYRDLNNFGLILKWFGLWTFFSIASLLMVQFPDDRYMQICYLWLPSMIGCAIGFIW